MPRSSIPADMRREQIINAAVKLFSDVGYRATSLRDIASHVGITHPGLLYHFHTKEELLQIVLDRRDEQARERFSLDPGSKTATELLYSILAQISVAGQETPGLVELFATLSAEATNKSHPSHSYFKKRYAMFVGNAVGVLDELAKDGKLNRTINHEAFARTFIAMWDGLQLQWLYDREVDMITPMIALLNTILVDPIEPDKILKNR